MFTFTFYNLICRCSLSYHVRYINISTLCCKIFKFIHCLTLWRLDLKILELWFLCCIIMMFSWIKKQPGIQKFCNLCSHYQDIYEWISPFNKQSDWWFILTQHSMVESEYGKSRQLSFFHFFEALNDAF